MANRAPLPRDTSCSGEMGTPERSCVRRLPPQQGVPGGPCGARRLGPCVALCPRAGLSQPAVSEVAFEEEEARETAVPAVPGPTTFWREEQGSWSVWGKHQMPSQQTAGALSPARRGPAQLQGPLPHLCVTSCGGVWWLGVLPPLAWSCTPRL